MNHTIDLRQLRYFVAVSEERHVGRAALRLHMSQPPLSRQIRQLEDQLGVALFVRGPAGVALTEAGRAFLPEARKTLAQADKAVGVARAFQAGSGQRFVIGHTTVVDRSAIPDVAGPLRAAFPGWRIVTRGAHSIRLVRALQQGTIDAAFIGLHTEAPGLTVETLREEALVLALPAGHALARRRSVGLGEIGDTPLFWFERRLNPGFYDHCAALFARLGFAPAMLPEPLEHHVTLGLIAAGQGVALVPASMRQLRRDGVVYRPLKPTTPALTMGVAVAYAPAKRSPALATFLALARASVA